MKRDRYHAELTRQDPQVLADMITKRDERIAALEHLIQATGIVREIFPEAYLKAAFHLYWIGHTAATNPKETTSRPVPASRPPGHNPEALRVWKDEKAVLNGRAAWLSSAADQAVRYPNGKPKKERPPRNKQEPRNHAA